MEAATWPGSIHMSPASRSAGERVFSPKYTPGRYEPQNREGELVMVIVQNVLHSDSDRLIFGRNRSRLLNKIEVVPSGQKCEANKLAELSAFWREITIWLFGTNFG